MTCTQRRDALLLADYWINALPQYEQDRIEEHLFACDECSARLSEIAALATAIRHLAREGSMMMIVSEAFLKRAAEEGLHISQYAPPAGGSVQCTVTAQDDLLIGRLAANLSSAKRIDLSLCDPGGHEQFRLPDIPFDSTADSVLWQQSITFAKAAPTGTMIARLIAKDDSGSETLLGEYTFNHTRTLPGPAAW
jgi:hypothetical protein